MSGVMNWFWHSEMVLTRLQFKLLSRNSRGEQPEVLCHMYKILDGENGSPTEARVIIRCPWGWTPERFQAEALKAWGKNPSVEIVISCHAAESVDMDLNFLTREWRGKGVPSCSGA